MSNAASSRWRPLSPATGLALGMAGAGVAALIGAALYSETAFVFDIDDWPARAIFAPAMITFACCIGLLRRRREAAVIVLTIFAALGLVFTLLQSDWGGSIGDITPERNRRFDNYTYASNLLFCFAYLLQLASVSVLALARWRRFA